LVLRLPVAIHVPVAGSYNSQLAVEVAELTWPPVTSTFPLDNKVAVCVVRPMAIGALAVHPPAAGSYSSELARRTVPLKPPTTSTLPLGNKVAECPDRAPLSALVVVKGTTTVTETGAERVVALVLSVATAVSV